MKSQKSDKVHSILSSAEDILGGSIVKPIFYNFKGNSIRFDMTGNSNSNQERFNSCIERSRTIFNSVFKKTNRLTVFLEFFSQEQYKDFHESPMAFENLQLFINGNVHESIKNCKVNEQVLFDEDSEEINGYFYQYLYEIEAKYEFLQPMFQSVAGNEIQMSELPPLLFYLLDLENKVLFHLYDDRGLDIMCVSSGSLRSLFEEFENWILSYDFNEIKQSIFKDNR